MSASLELLVLRSSVYENSNPPPYPIVRETKKDEKMNPFNRDKFRRGTHVRSDWGSIGVVSKSTRDHVTVTWDESEGGGSGRYTRSAAQRQLTPTS